MVSVYPSPTMAHQDFYCFGGGGGGGGGGGMGDPMMKIGLPCLHSLNPVVNVNDHQSATAVGSLMNDGSGTLGDSGLLDMEDPNSKKVRKPYTITKSRESWTDQEHDKFLEALQLFDRDWKKIEAFVGSKTVIQIRSHAQKYFLKVQKSGTSEHVPAPRPKRKASHPYPQKAPKNVVTQVSGQFHSSSGVLEPKYVIRPDSSSVPRTAVGNPVVPSWAYNPGTSSNISRLTRDDTGFTGAPISHNYSSSSNESTPRMWTEKENHRTRAMPDFAQVYGFIGSIFDPNATDHLPRLQKMDPINVETVLMLMKNLSVNLVSPEFEDHRRLISSYGEQSIPSHINQVGRLGNVGV